MEKNEDDKPVKT